jgi:hypothetical protein
VKGDSNSDQSRSNQNRKEAQATSKAKRAHRRVVADSVDVTKSETWVEVFPSGIVLAPGSIRPVLLLKTADQAEVLPIWMGGLDAGVSLNQLSQGGEGSPHVGLVALCERLGVKEVRCRIAERVGHHQYCKIEFSCASPLTETWLREGLRLRVDEAMSFCLALRARFFSEKNFMRDCRVLNQEIETLQEGLTQGEFMQAFPEFNLNHEENEVDDENEGEMLGKKTRYMM